MTTDAFGVAKAWKGQEGDKRNTKYYAAGVVGANVGRPVGARAAVGSASLKAVKSGRNAAMLNAFENTGESVVQAAAKAPKVMRMRLGGSAGGMLGAAAGMGGYAAYRHSQTGKRRVGASVAGQEARRSAELASLRANPGKSKVEKKRNPMTRDYGFDSQEALERTEQDLKARSAFVSRTGTQRKKNWKTLGQHVGAGTAIGAAGGAGFVGASGMRNPKSLLTGAAVGAGAGAAGGLLTGTTHTGLRAVSEAENASIERGDQRLPGKGERTSVYHNLRIVPKKEYQKAHFKAVKRENETLRQQLAEREANVSYIHKSAFGVDHEYEEVSKLGLKPLVQAAKVGFKGGMTPYAPGSAGARATTAGAGIKTGIGQIKTGIGTGAAKVNTAISAKPKTALGIGAGVGGVAAGGVGYGMGQKKRY